MDKKYDIYLSYHSLDESLGNKIKNIILSYRPNLKIYSSSLDDSSLDMLSKSSIYMPIITNNFFNLKYSSIFKKEMILFSELEEKGEMKIETFSNTKDILFNDLSVLNNDVNKTLFEITRGLSFIFINENNITDMMDSIIYFIDEDLEVKDDSDYRFDVFLSWTWKDHLVKDELKNHFISMGLKVYDSEKECHNKFTSNFLGALLKSKTYVLLLSDSLNREDIVSDVRREIQTATDLEKKLRLNIEIVVLSESYLSHDFGNYSNVSKFFYDTSGFDRVDATEGITNEVLEELDNKINNYIISRDSGKPIFYNPDFGIIKEKPKYDSEIFGRDKEVSEIEKAFNEGNKIVILSGIGGIGKTKIAEKFAYKMDKEMKNYIQTIKISDILSFDEGDAYNLILDNINYTNKNKALIESLKDDEKKVREVEESIVKSLPPYSIIIVDNINKINVDSMIKVIERLNINLVFTSRITSFDLDKVKVIDVLPFNCEELYTEFKERSKLNDLELEDFIEIYDAVLGHTMTLFMLSKIAKNYSSKKELMVIKDDLSAIKDKVWVDHNDINKKITITEQLKALFKITDLSDKAQEILLELSLINDGSIMKADLKNYFILDSYNEINELCENGGWVSINDDKITINSFLSEIMPKLIDSEHRIDDFMHVIKYIVECADYSNPYKLLDRAFFALYKLSIYTNDYDKELYELFLKATIKSYNSNDILKKAEQLLKKNYNPIIRLLYLSVLVERNNTDESILSEFIDILDSTSITERKIAFKYLCRYSYILKDNYHKRLERLINKTLKAIILSKPINGDTEEETRIRQYMIFGLYGLSAIFKTNIPKSITDSYRRCDKNNPYNTIYYTYFTAFSGNYNKFIDLYNSNYNGLNGLTDEEKDVALTKIGFKMIFLHPILTLKANIYNNKILKYKPKSNDEVYLKNLTLYLNNLIDNKQLNVKELFSSAIDYYDFLFDNDLTLIKQNKFIKNTYDIIGSFTKNIGNKNQIDTFKKEIGLLVSNSDIDVLNHNNLSQALVFGIFYSALKDEKALDTAKLIYDSSVNLYGIDSFESIGFILNYANSLFEFYRHEEAIIKYSEYFDLLMSKGYFSPDMEDAFVNMLVCHIYDRKPINLFHIQNICDYILKGLLNNGKLRVIYNLLFTMDKLVDNKDEYYTEVFNKYLDEYINIAITIKTQKEKDYLYYHFLELRLFISSDYLLKFKKIFRKYLFSLSIKQIHNTRYIIKTINLSISSLKDKTQIIKLLKYSFKYKDYDLFIKYIQLLVKESNTFSEFISYFTDDETIINNAKAKYEEITEGNHFLPEHEILPNIYPRSVLYELYKETIDKKLTFKDYSEMIIRRIICLRIEKRVDRTILNRRDSITRE